MNPGGQEPRWTWLALGLAFATGATLVLEITLTRIFSIILWYHYGFMTISLALLGLGLAGVVVYLYPERFSRERAAAASARAALGFGAASVGAILVFHWIVSQGSHWPLGAGWRTAIFLTVLVPFFFAGLAVAIPISRFNERIGALYAADLIGAAIGAVAVIPLIGWLGGHPLVVGCGALACLASACFAIAARSRGATAVALAAALVCSVAVPVAKESDFFRIRYAKHAQAGGAQNWGEDKVVAERWNSFSRVAAYEPRRGAFGWNLAKARGEAAPEFMTLRIDGGAATPMIRFDGDLERVDYLRNDITSLGYQLRPARSALVVGAGGGRDVLTARLLGVEQVQAVEINPIIVDFVRKRFRDYSGSPYDLPGVSFAVGDGRNFVAETEKSFDLIQISAVDTTAAAAAGALALVENSLYTVEAFQAYFDHLEDGGLLSITRNWNDQSQLMALRSADMIREAWSSRGVEQVERHLLIVAPGERFSRWGTLLASKQPFREEELEPFRRRVEELGFRFLYDPGRSVNPPAFAELFGPEREQFLDEYPYDVAASTDDRPYYFFFYRPFGGDSTAWETNQQLAWGARKTPRVLLQAFALVAVLVAVLAFGGPIALGRLRLGDARGSGRGLVYFAAIGFGFILVEISLIQRFTLLLGQPLYAFSGILSCVLVASGLGSLVTHSLDDARAPRVAGLALTAIAVLVLAYALFLPPLLLGAMSWSLGARLALTVCCVFPLGLLMGMPLPLGMRLLAWESPQALPWAWGVNGSLSVLGTVVAMVVSIFFGITATLLVGAAAYLCGVPIFRRAAPPAGI